MPNGRRGVTMRIAAGNAAWLETTYDVATGLAIQLRTFQGPSPIYHIQTELALTALPPVPPTAPRLSISLDPSRTTVTVSVPTEADKLVTLLVSNDGGRSWRPVPEFEDRAGTGAPFLYTQQHPSGSALYHVRVR
jgi:hypothetical protein